MYFMHIHMCIQNKSVVCHKVVIFTFKCAIRLSLRRKDLVMYIRVSYVVKGRPL